MGKNESEPMKGYIERAVRGDGEEVSLQKVNVCKYPPIGRMEILSMAGLCL